MKSQNRQSNKYDECGQVGLHIVITKRRVAADEPQIQDVVSEFADSPAQYDSGQLEQVPEGEKTKQKQRDTHRLGDRVAFRFADSAQNIAGDPADAADDSERHRDPQGSFEPPIFGAQQQHNRMRKKYEQARNEYG